MQGRIQNVWNGGNIKGDRAWLLYKYKSRRPITLSCDITAANDEYCERETCGHAPFSISSVLSNAGPAREQQVTWHICSVP